MTLIDLNGNHIKHVEETDDLKQQAEKRLFEKLDKATSHVAELLTEYQDFPELLEAMHYPIKEFGIKIEELKTILLKGKLTTYMLGIPQEEDYTDLRKALMKEMMYYIDNHKGE